MNLSSLPSNVNELHSIIRHLNSKNIEFEQANEKMNVELQLLNKKYYILRHELFGTKSERLKLEVAEQARLFNEAEHTVDNPETKNITIKSYRRKKKKKKHGGRKAIPDNYPEEEVIHDLTKEEKICPCCENEMQKIGDDISRNLQVIPEKIYVEKNVYH